MFFSKIKYEFSMCNSDRKELHFTFIKLFILRRVGNHLNILHTKTFGACVCLECVPVQFTPKPLLIPAYQCRGHLLNACNTFRGQFTTMLSLVHIHVRCHWVLIWLGGILVGGGCQKQKKSKTVFKCPETKF